jgi:nucleoside-diphosphate-sugar epimerase
MSGNRTPMERQGSARRTYEKTKTDPKITFKENHMKILITGTEGYLGSMVAPYLMRHGFDVTGLDSGFYRNGLLYNANDYAPVTVYKDIRRVTEEDLRGYEAIVHMAELSNDPLGQLAPEITYQINHKGSIHLAETARRAGVRRFVYMSSCSVYGVVENGMVVDETSPVNPQTAYAECKVMVERDLSGMADDSFTPCYMRNATAYGASPRMRFDIVLNNLSGLAWVKKEIAMTSDGTPWRPLVHALDIAKSIRCALQAPLETVHNQTFNVGDTTHNYTVRQIAEVVAEVFEGCTLSFGSAGADNRSYRVSFEKINTLLPGFSCEWDARKGAQQLYNVFKAIDMDAETFHHRAFTRLKQLEHLIRTSQIDPDFFFKPYDDSSKETQEAHRVTTA